MGASQYKKKRNEEREAGMTAKEKTDRNKKRLLYTLGGLVAALLVAVIIIVNSPLFSNGFTAAKIGDTNYTLAGVRYGYQSSYSQFANNYGDSMSYFIDTSKDLSEQTCLFDSTLSWKEYFQQQGLTYLQEMTALYDAAAAEGYEITEDEQAAIDNQISTMESYASMLGYSKDGYLAAYYGAGNNEASVREMLRRNQIAYDYAADKQLSFTYTGDELDAYYTENIDNYATVTYKSAYFSAAADEENGVTAEAAMEEAHAKAEAVESACSGTPESFETAVLAETGSEASEQSAYYVSLGDNYDWFTDAARRPGDTLISESSSGVTVYCYLSRELNDYNAVSFRHILINAVDADGDGVYSEEEKATALAALEAIQAEWDGTEEDFIRLAGEKSEDAGSNTNGGLYEDVVKGQMVAGVNDFCFGERTAGDSEIVLGESSNYTGYHLLYFVGEGELASRLMAESTKRSEDFAQWEQALLENYPITTTFMFRYA